MVSWGSKNNLRKRHWARVSAVVFYSLARAHRTPSVIDVLRADKEGTWPHPQPHRRGLASQNKKNIWEGGYSRGRAWKIQPATVTHIQCLAKCLVLNGLSRNINGRMNKWPSSPSIGCIILCPAIETASLLVFFPAFHPMSNLSLIPFSKDPFSKTPALPMSSFQNFQSP